ncbi:MAG: TonB-dependent receptor, partial [Paramuribaculum sp.]|nr:TonB-dependent receptor [Paramuribaculum sp.]
VGAKINGSPLRWLSIDYSINYSSSRLAISGSSASWLGSLENSMTLSIIPYKKWHCKINGEHYLNEIAADSYKHVLLVDAEISYSLTKHIGLTASLSNLFNHRTYYYKTYNQLNSFESLRWLRGRELLLTISFKK